MLVLLDSTVLIDYLRGRPVVKRVDALQRGGDVPCTTPINVEEIVRGLRAREEAAARDLIAGLDVLPIRAPDGWLAGVWRREYAKRGMTLWQADCLIAAVAMNAGAVLATGNPKDFPMRELNVETWTAGQESRRSS